MVKKVGNSHLGFIYHLVNNNLYLFTFQEFFYAPSVSDKPATDLEDDDKDKPENRSDKESYSRNSKFENKNRPESEKGEIMIAVETQPTKTTKHKTTGPSEVAMGCRCIKCVKTSKEVKVKISKVKPTAKDMVKSLRRPSPPASLLPRKSSISLKHHIPLQYINKNIKKIKYM